MNMYNILIVDDEKIERNGIKLLLKRMGINLGVIEAENGKEAYDFSKDKPITLIDGQALLGLLNKYGYSNLTIKINK